MRGRDRHARLVWSAAGRQVLTAPTPSASRPSVMPCHCPPMFLSSGHRVGAKIEHSVQLRGWGAGVVQWQNISFPS
jgi:hypothetical protein